MILRNIMLWISLLVLSCSQHVVDVAKADYQASFGGTSFAGLTRQSTIAEYDGTVDDSGNLLDMSGSNYLVYSDAMDSWTLIRATVTADQYQSPETNLLTGDVLVEDNSAATTHYYAQNVTTVSGTKYRYEIDVKALNRSWARLYANGDSAQADFNVSTGVVGTAIGATSTVIPKSGGWYRLSMEWTSATSGTNAIRLYICEADTDCAFDGVLAQQALVVAAAQMSKLDAWRSGVGPYHATGAANKPLHDLSPTNAPGEVATYFQRPDGNLWKGRSFNGSNQQYSIASHDSFKIYDGNHTFTIVAASDAETNIISQFSLTPGAGGGIRQTSVYEMKYIKLDGSYTSNVVNPCGGGIRTDSRYHAHHLIRTGNWARLSCDGALGAPVDVSNGGIDVTQTFYLGGAAGVFFDGNILYARLDAEALTDSQALQEEQRLIGIGASAGGNQFPEHTFTRATTATYEFNGGSLGYAASGVPRVTDGFLSEPSSQNTFSYSEQVDNAYWEKGSDGALGGSITANAAVAPDGQTTADKFAEGAAGLGSTVHYFSGPATTVASASYTTSAYFQYITGGREWIYMRDRTVGDQAWFNLAQMRVGTIGAGIAAAGVEPHGNWYRLYITRTTTSSEYVSIATVPDDGSTASYAGDARDNFYVWGLDSKLTNSSYVPTTTAAATRNADVLTIDPFKYEDYVRVGTETMSFNFDQPWVASGDTVTSNASADYDAGKYTFSSFGTRVPEVTERYGAYYKFDGSSTRFSKSAETAFIPDSSGSGANFSMVGALVPDTPATTYGYVFGRYDTSGSDREYSFYLNQSGTCSGAVSHDGANSTFATKTGTCYVATRPLFFAFTYSYSGVADAPGATTGTSTGKLYINDMTVVTDNAFLGPVRNGAANLFIGRSTNGSYYQGKMLWLNWYKGTVLDAATVASMYDQWKQKWLIAPQMGDANEETKLYINFDYKLRASSASAGGDSLVELGNNYGKSDSNSNRISCAALTTTLVCSYWNDTTTATQRTITVSGLTQNTWHTVAYYVDLANLANSTMTVNGTAGTPASMTSSSSVNWRDASIHVGHDYTGAAGFANGWVRNVKVLSRP